MRARPLFRSFFVVVACWATLSSAFAARSADDDPPDRVARLSFIKGEVSLKPAGMDEWAEARLNRPLTTDDQLWLDRNARAELHTGASTIHLDENTAFSFSELSDDVLQMRLTDGALHLTVRRMRDGEVIEVDTPHAAVTVTRPGEYHIEVADNNQRTLVKTYSGECEVTGNGTPLRIGEREQAVVDGSGRRADARERFSSRDPFDRWAQERNERMERAVSARHVAPDVIGYEDLDDYGEWRSEPDYGDVWYPTRVIAGWSPYRYGHWVWVSPWGWTWVDDAPWGFAPFHYGRWAFVRSRWCWVPGPVRVRAVYAPALVAWVGSPNVSVSVSIGPNIGWFPLAPHEIFVPAYHFSRRHLHDINYSNTVIVNNVIINRVYVNRETHFDYRNRDVRDAVTVIPREHFVSARPVREHIVHTSDGNIRGWQTRNVAPPLAPERISVFGPGGAREHRVLERGNERINRDVVTQRNPPPRASFSAEQRAIQENNNRPIPRRELFQPDTRARGDDVANNRTQNSREGRFQDRPRRLYDRSLEASSPSGDASAPTNPARESGRRDSRTETPSGERTGEPARGAERSDRRFERRDPISERREESREVNRNETRPDASMRDRANEPPREQPQRNDDRRNMQQRSEPMERRNFGRGFERIDPSEPRETPSDNSRGNVERRESVDRSDAPNRSGRMEMNGRFNGAGMRSEQPTLERPPERAPERVPERVYAPHRVEPRAEPQRIERSQPERTPPPPSSGRAEQREDRRERNNPHEFNRGMDRDR